MLLIVSSGLLRRISLIRTDVSEERIAFIIRVTRIGELHACFGWYLLLTLFLSRRFAILTRATRLKIPEDGILHSHRRETLEFYLLMVCS
jgi:hypothetical protein